MLHTYLPDNTIKLRFTSIFDDAAVPVITHDFNAKTLRLGPGYSILDENGDPLGAGGGGGITGTIAANQIAFGAGADEIGGDAGFTFDPADPLALDNAFLRLSVTYDGSDMNDYAIGLFQQILTPGDLPDAVIVGGYFKATASGFDIGGTIGLTVQASSSADNGYLNPLNIVLGAGGGVIGEAVAIDVSVSLGGATTDTAIGLRLPNISGATGNYAIKAGAGDIVFGTLAGSGTRYVYVDDDGKLVAGAAV